MRDFCRAELVIPHPDHYGGEPASEKRQETIFWRGANVECRVQSQNKRRKRHRRQCQRQCGEQARQPGANEAMKGEGQNPQENSERGQANELHREQGQQRHTVPESSRRQPMPRGQHAGQKRQRRHPEKSTPQSLRTYKPNSQDDASPHSNCVDEETEKKDDSQQPRPRFATSG